MEYLEPSRAFSEAGHEVVTIEKEQGKTVTGKKEKAEVKIDESIDNVKPEDFDALFIPGGFSPDQLREDERFVQFAKHSWTRRNQSSPSAMDRSCCLLQKRLKQRSHRL